MPRREPVVVVVCGGIVGQVENRRNLEEKCIFAEMKSIKKEIIKIIGLASLGGKAAKALEIWLFS